MQSIRGGEETTAANVEFGCRFRHGADVKKLDGVLGGASLIISSVRLGDE